MIVVNGREKDVSEGRKLTYDEVVAFAYKNPPKGVDFFTITYSQGHAEKPDGMGMLAKSETVKVKDGMLFDVTDTSSA